MTKLNEVAQALIGRPYLSHSSLSTYRTCPLRFYFRYVASVQEEFVSSSLVFGSAIHSALERFFADQFEGLSAPEMSDLLAAYRGSWSERDGENLRFRDGETTESLEEQAKRMLTAFLVSPAAKVEGRLLGVEEELTRTIQLDCPDLLARLDLLIDAGDSLVVRDFKTSRSKWSAEQLDVEAAQLLLYHEVVRELADGRPIHLEFVILTKTKAPSIDIHRVEFDEARLRWQADAFRSTWQAIRAGSFFPSPSVLACSGCSYRNACRSRGTSGGIHPDVRRNSA